MIKLSVVEDDGMTVGSATWFIEEAMRVKQIVIDHAVTGACLMERRLRDGRGQCIEMTC